MVKTFLLFSVFTAFAAAQPVGAGLKVGGTLTDPISFNAPDLGGKNLIVGPYVEFRFPGKLSLDVELLYNRGALSGVSNGSVLQFPVLLKYRFLDGPLRPYLTGGASFSHLTDIPDIVALNHRSNFGIVFGGGVELKTRIVRISPELRYTGNLLRNLDSPTGSFSSNRAQVAFLVGFGF